MHEEGDRINGQYEVRQRLAGGMGYVYIVFDEVSHQVFAIKTLKDEFRDIPLANTRFEREARVWINLGKHENIVHAISFFRGKQPLLLLEYVDGANLHKLMQCEPKGLAASETVALAVDMARGLSFAHTSAMPGGKRGVIHRDLKPGNVMITRQRAAKLTDFGLARAQDDTELTSSRDIMGTLPYIPPEQWLDSHLVNDQADIYSFGVVLYQMITGARPFPGPTEGELYHQVHNCAPEPIEAHREGVDPDLADLVMQCLRKRTADRPKSAEIVLHRLRAIQERQRKFAEPDSHAPCTDCGYRPNSELVRCPICGTAAPERATVAADVRQCRCGQLLPDGHRFCVACGRQYPSVVVCGSCAAPNSEEHRFCCSCGRPMTGGPR
jgi:serine/threonine-protein kinase